MASGTPKRTIKVANVALPAGTEVRVNRATFTAIAGVSENGSLKGLEFSSRLSQVLRFATQQSGTQDLGTHRTIKVTNTLFFEDMEISLALMESQPFWFKMPSGTDDVLEIVFSQG